MAFTISKSTYDYTTHQYTTEDERLGEGTTLAVWQDHVQVMSDIWETATHALHWDGERLITSVWVKDAKVDATDEVYALVEAATYQKYLNTAIEKAKEEASKIVKDAVVEVKRGRTSKGVRGKVVVSIMRDYGMGYRASLEQKVAIATSDRKVMKPAANGKVYENYADVVWVWARNVDLVEVPEINMGECIEIAKEKVARFISDLKAKPNRKVYR